MPQWRVEYCQASKVSGSQHSNPPLQRLTCPYSYLGDALVHASFAVLAYASGIFHPVSVLGPVANYAFLRFVGGDKENEATQESRYKSQNPSKYAQLEDWRQKKNSFWPSVKEAANPWTWALVAIGGAGIVVESGLRRYLRA